MSSIFGDERCGTKVKTQPVKQRESGLVIKSLNIILFFFAYSLYFLRQEKLPFTANHNGADELFEQKPSL